MWCSDPESSCKHVFFCFFCFFTNALLRNGPGIRKHNCWKEFHNQFSDNATHWIFISSWGLVNINKNLMWGTYLYSVRNIYFPLLACLQFVMQSCWEMFFFLLAQKDLGLVCKCKRGSCQKNTNKSSSSRFWAATCLTCLLKHQQIRILKECIVRKKTINRCMFVSSCSGSFGSDQFPHP